MVTASLDNGAIVGNAVTGIEVGLNVNDKSHSASSKSQHSPGQLTSVHVLFDS